MTRKPLALLTTTWPGGIRSPLPYAAPIENAGFEVVERGTPEANNLHQFLSMLRLGPRIRRYSLIVANEYSTALALGLLARAFRARARMIVLSLNLSRRPIRVPVPPLQNLLDRALQRFDAIVVHSSPEVSQFVKLHNLDPSRFQVVPWGYDLPPSKHRNRTDLPKPYVCVVGRNNRDFATVATGLAGTGVGGVFVGAPSDLESDDPEIRCLNNVPYDECIGIMADALANVIPLQDSSRGAGHITAVTGMLLAKPHIFSNVDTLSDYLRDGREGIAVPIGDASAIRSAVNQLVSNPELRKKMGHAGRKRALREMSHDMFLKRICSVILNSNGAGASASMARG